MEKDLKQAALSYHEAPRPGKISVVATKGLTNQRDLALAYTPGVAAVCHAIVKDPAYAGRATARSNLVGIVTNGTAVLGLGAIGPLAAKPVMEGKAVLFKKFAGIDAFDIELNELDPEKLVEIIASLEPTFGGINLEDIKAPECFFIERKLRERLKIPVFHDDQHGTSIIVGAAILNGLFVVGKDISTIQLVTSGAGAAALACLNLLVKMGLSVENITVTDIHGVVYEGRVEEMDAEKARYARKTSARSLEEVIQGADVFLGLSAANVLKPHMVKTMAPRPLIFALANPEPEISPEMARLARPDAIVATGRSDYPNQVNNVLCFPFIFRGALDVGATSITTEMELAAVQALAELARAEPTEQVAIAYGSEPPAFGPEYLIPRPFDPRLITRVAPAVAKAAMECGVATRPLPDLELYRQSLSEFVYHSGLIMRPVFAAAKEGTARIVYAEGEDDRVLRAVQVVVEEGLAKPILIGRPAKISSALEHLGLHIRPKTDFSVIDPEEHSRYRQHWAAYGRPARHNGVPSPSIKVGRPLSTLIGAMLVRHGDADGMLCGTTGLFAHHLDYVEELIGRRAGIRAFATMNAVILGDRTVFICDTQISPHPGPEHIVEMTQLAAAALRRFGLVPKIALLAASNFGSAELVSALQMRKALRLLRRCAPELQIDGEMQGDTALSEELRLTLAPNSPLKGQVNLLIMPSLDAANIAFTLLKAVGGSGVTIGPILLGAAQAVHVLTATASVRSIVNMTAVAAVQSLQP